MFRYASNKFLRFKDNIFHKMGNIVNIHWTFISSMVQSYIFMNLPYITKVMEKHHAFGFSDSNTTLRIDHNSTSIYVTN